ncbi:Fusaric acid resistance family protein [Neorhizobium galegae bv. orientalis]|nr:Fusaric acid resistance family protein [Neorhizobium galegae bv. orientalis]
MALAAALVATFAMSFELPDAAVSCYLVTLIMKPGGGETVLEAIVLTILIAAVIVVVVILSRWTVDAPALRLLTMAVVSFAMLFLAATSQLGGMASILGMLIAVILSLLYESPTGDIFSTGLRYYFEMVAMPMGVIALFSLTLGVSTVELLRRTLDARLTATWEAIQSPSALATATVRKLLHRGNQQSLKRVELATRFHLVPTDSLAQIRNDISASYYMLIAAAAFRQLVPLTGRSRIADDVAAARSALAAGKRIPVPQELRLEAASPERVVHEALTSMAEGAATKQPPAQKVPFFVQDAFSNPAYQRYALKTTLAAMVCYIIYTSLDWQGIHTAMITCYVASLRTTGDTMHKLILRIGGCFVGAALGIGTIVWIVPHVDSVGGLMLLIFFGTLPAAWLSAGGERLSYAGIQIGLVYYLSVLHGFGPSLDMEIARDRFIGILVGNVAVYLVATLIWPIRLDQALRQDVARALENLAKFASIQREDRSKSLACVVAVETALDRLEEATYRLPLERGWASAEDSSIDRFQAIATEIERLNTEIFFANEDLRAIAPRLQALSTLAVKGRAAPREAHDISEIGSEQPASDPITVSLRRLELELRGLPA